MTHIHGPYANNRLASRQDAQTLVTDLFDPLLGNFSDGKARVRISEYARNFEPAAGHLEGFARPLWGIAPLLAGGGTFPYLDYYIQGLANGTNPTHSEYWGLVLNFDARAVEMAAIGYALAIAPEFFWDPLSPSAKDNLAGWLKGIERVAMYDDNWHFFVVLVQQGLSRVGVAIDESVRDSHLKRIEDFYLGDGWYGDGPEGYVDHYNGFALHTYGLLYASLNRDRDTSRAAAYIERSRQFARSYRYWFADNGPSVPYGRSMTYRFGMASFWGALAVSGIEALPWPEIRGIWARHIRWWLSKPIADAAGHLSIGYLTENPSVAEEYASSSSPYWAMKALLPLSLPSNHPFWSASEAPPSNIPSTTAVPAARFIIHSRELNAVLLPGGATVTSLRSAPDKYGKFAYSSAFGFCVDSDRYIHLGYCGDNALALSPDGRHWRVREEVLNGYVAGDRLHTKWQPWEGCVIDSVQFMHGPWEIRSHRIVSDRSYQSLESGYALPGWAWQGCSMGPLDGGPVLRSEGSISVLKGVGKARRNGIRPAMPNSSLTASHAALPVLYGDIPAGETTIVCALYAQPNEQDAPPLPSDDELLQILG